MMRQCDNYNQMHTEDHKCHGKNKTYNKTKRTLDKTVIQPQFTAKLNELTARQRQFFTVEGRSHGGSEMPQRM